jgi:hypothetical protein
MADISIYKLLEQSMEDKAIADISLSQSSNKTQPLS